MENYGLPGLDASNQFQGAFGYPQLPTQELMAEQQQQRAKAMEQEALQERLKAQMERALAIRNKPRENPQTWVEGLSNLASFAGGDANVRRAEGRQETNDNALSKSMAAAQEAEAQKGLRGEQTLFANSMQAWDNQNQNRDSQDERSRLDREGRKEIALMRARTAAQKMAAAKAKTASEREPDGYIREAGDVTQARHRAVWNPQAGEEGLYEGKDGQTWTQDEVKQYGPQEIKTQKERKLAAESGQHLKTTYKFMDMTEEDWEKVGSPIEGMPTEVLTEFFLSGEREGIWDWMEKQNNFLKGAVGKNIDRDAMQEAISTMNEIRTHVIMPYREETTSGVLSNQDVKEFTKNILMQHGTPGKLLHRSAQNLLTNREAHLRSRLRGWEQEGDEDAYTRAKGGIQSLREEGWQEAQAKARYRDSEKFDFAGYESAQKGFDKHGMNTQNGKDAARYLQEYANEYVQEYQKRNP